MVEYLPKNAGKLGNATNPFVTWAGYTQEATPRAGNKPHSWSPHRLNPEKTPLAFQGAQHQ
eukprot:1964957-Amphidinium_carterae.1